MDMDSSSASGMSTSMSMPSSTMAGVSGMSMTSTVSTAMASASSGRDMGGMSMGGGSGASCKISMLWNWYSVDACFLSSQWQIKSSGMMAGSCIGVVVLVMSLELLRRASKEYDAYIARKHMAANPPMAVRGSSESDSDNKGPSALALPVAASRRSFKPSLLQQVVRATFHMLQFAVAYFVMLLAMYFNGYIIISIIVGAFLGAFIFGWHDLALPGEQRELTYCCG